MFEGVLDWYHRAYGLQFNAFRYFNAAGASERLGEDHKHESHLIPLVLKRAMGEMRRHRSEVTTHHSPLISPLKVFGNDYPTRDGTCVRDYVHVVDLVQAHILALDNLDRHPNGKYNLGNGQGFTVREVIEVAREVTGHSIPAEAGPRRPGDLAVLVASSERLREELDWQPRYTDLREIVQTAWDWHRTHPDGYED